MNQYTPSENKFNDNKTNYVEKYTETKDSFVMDLNEKFSIDNEWWCDETKRLCECVAKVFQEGYMVYCKNCNYRIPSTGFYQNPYILNNAFVAKEMSILLEDKHYVIENAIIDKDENFLMNLTEKFSLDKNLVCCKTDQKCECIAKVSQEGYMVYCKNCNYRLPSVGFYPNNPVLTKAFGIFGIEIDCIPPSLVRVYKNQ